MNNWYYRLMSKPITLAVLLIAVAVLLVALNACDPS